MGYIPPEAMRRESGVEVSSAEFKKGDVYSFGVLMCYILSGADPYARMSDAQIVVMITVTIERPVIPSDVDEDPDNPVFKEMIQQLWHSDPQRRSDFATIVKQLREHVVHSNLQQHLSPEFIRTLPPLFAGIKWIHVYVELGGIMSKLYNNF